MESGFYYLSYYQVMSLMYGIDQIRKRNQYFSDEISESFEEYVLSRAGEITMYSPIILKINPNAGKYIVSRSMIEYLIRLTGINIFDSNALDEYTQLVKKLEHDSIAKALDGSLFRKRSFK